MPHRTLQEEERSLWTLFGTFFKIGLFTFGGGYAMIALLENEFITKKHWLGRDEFLDMAAIAESTPGPVAINSATYLGYKLAGAIARELLALCPAFDCLDEYRSRCFVPGHWVTVCTAAETYAARAIAIDDNGALLVEREGGRRAALQHGEVSIRPTKTE